MTPFTRRTPDVTFILLSFARPHNMQRILDSVLQAESCARVIVCNNQPKIDIHDHLTCSESRVEIIQSNAIWGPVRRYHIAQNCPGDFFVCIDDDVFLTPAQIDQLVRELAADPSRPHGVWGQTILTDGRKIQLTSGVHNVNQTVAVLNCVYAFTKAQAQRVVEFLDIMSLKDLREIGPGDDIFLAFSGNQAPLCHDVGPLEFCPNHDQPGVARFRSDNFSHRRLRLWLRLRTLMAAASDPKTLSAKIDATTTGDVASDDRTQVHRRNLLYALRGAGTYLGVGFDEGRSVLMALTLFPHLKYLGVDDRLPADTVACGDYLSEIFGSRFKLIKGSSRDILPWLAAQNPDPKPDLIHIEAGLDKEKFRLDLSNALQLSDDYTRILIEDAGAPDIQNVIGEFQQSGHLRLPAPPAAWVHTTQRLAARHPVAVTPP